MTVDQEAAWAPERRAQSLARECLARAVAELAPGHTERDVGASLRKHAFSLGARGFFHEPLVWFGERTRLDKSRLKSLPGRTRLQLGDVVMLDIAPNFDGVPADVSVTTSLGENPTVVKGQEALRELRARIPERVHSCGTARELVQWVDSWARSAGLELHQEGYLFHALAHRVYRTPAWPWVNRSVGGVGLAAGIQLFGAAALSKLPGLGARWPFWNDTRASQRPIGAGLWSFEPHLILTDIGVKWEELLVVDASGARWLEPDPPAPL
tara:strand:+ start:541 stop:1344 length:804 start_codon:yes stop_codon:yes gene_type:complete